MAAQTNFISSHRRRGVQDTLKRAEALWWVYFAGVIGLTGAICLLLVRQTLPERVLGMTLILLGCASIFYRPVFGVYLMVFLALAGDSVLLPWYPFLKGFSSPESMVFLSRAIIFSPLELFLSVTMVSWAGRRIARKELQLVRGPLDVPVLLFLVFVILGLFYGLVTGGKTNVALWEARPLIHMALIYFLTTNMVKHRDQVNRLMWAAVLGLLCMSLSGILFFFFELRGDLAGVGSIMEHGSAIQLNSVLMMGLVAWMYKGSFAKRWGLLFVIACVLLPYFAAQRRAAFLTLAVALVVMMIYLYRDFRRIFWLTVPALVMAGVLYVAVFWNVTSTLGLPVQALKTVIAPKYVSARDQSSNYYRVLENINSSFTIHARPLTGVGFGQKFYEIVQLPDISFYVWHEYITHNSIIWIWMKMGVGGFLAMMYMMGMTLICGMFVINRMPEGDLRVIAMTATLYILMHFIYAYVDMAWDSRSLVYIGAMMGLINCLEQIAQKKVRPKKRRWPWQAQPQSEQAILPLA